MVTPAYAPRANSEGSIGTSALFWGGAYIDSLWIENAATKIAKDVSGNMTFTDAVLGTKTLTQLFESQPHTIGGSFHQVDSLANFNSKISDDDVQGVSEKGAANGYAELNAAGTIPLAQMPFNGINHIGNWDANANSPALASGVGTSGDQYTVSVPGTTLIDGVSDWQIGDKITFSGSLNIWEKTDNTDQVASVHGRQGVVVGAAGDYTAVQVTNDSGVAGSYVKNALDTLDTIKLNLAGGTMSGSVDMGTNNITNGGTFAGTSFNGVAITSVGSATQFLAADGSYKNIPASSVFPEILNTPTYTTLQHMLNLIGSAGTVCDNCVTDAGSGNVAVAAGVGFIRATDSEAATLFPFDWAADASIAIPTDTSRWIGITYNAGTPEIVVKTTDSWNENTEFRLAGAVNEAGVIHLINNPHIAFNGVGRIAHRLYETQPLARADRLGGLKISGTGTLNIAMTAGELYDNANEFDIAAIDTSGADTFDMYYGSFTKVAAQSAWDDQQYDNAGTLTAMTTGRYSTRFVYLEANGTMVLIYGTGNYTSEATANAEQPPTSVPDRVAVTGRLIGKIVFQKSAGTGTFYSVFDETF
jgi:hypothetical protein